MIKNYSILLILIIGLSLFSCTPKDTNTLTKFADIVNVSTSGNQQAYNFSVKLSSPDTGCNQYANWWEVIDESGELVYRRILGHSHVNEQPFTRSGGPVAIDESANVWVRAHMNNTGYGGKTFYGSVSLGFEEKVMPENFGADLETQEPQPGACAF